MAERSPNTAQGQGLSYINTHKYSRDAGVHIEGTILGPLATMGHELAYLAHIHKANIGLLTPNYQYPASLDPCGDEFNFNRFLQELSQEVVPIVLAMYMLNISTRSVSDRSF